VPEQGEGEGEGERERERVRSRSTVPRVITFADVEQARKRIRDRVYLSPCAHSETLSRKTGTKCWLKLENLQMTGSFKERGACNKLSAMSAEERARGVVCASAGNHAQGIAYHAARLGIQATIVMPEATPLIKVQSTKEFAATPPEGGVPATPARLVMHGASYDEAYEEALRIQAAEGLVFVHPFDDDLVMAGQGTIGLELMEQNPYLEAVVVAVGGGGLIAGVATAIKETNPRIKIYGVETAAIPSMKEALTHGAPVTVPAARTIAEGIAVRRAGQRTLALVQKYVDDIVTVDEEEIAEAILILLEREKTVAEGAGAAPLAALLHHRLPLAGKKVAAIICGGNIDVNVVSRIIERGLVKSGRMVRMHVIIPDVTGSLAKLTALLAEGHANVVQIHHDRTFASESGFGLSEAVVELVLEVRGEDHSADIRARLRAAGYTDISAHRLPGETGRGP
jgi:threonine dehydratase